MNITQVSARDINVTSRGATGTLATGQLALLDGRSLYQDFFGFVMWDFLPVNLNEIKQIEVHPRTGVRRLGRQRALRRRQRHHQVAARDAGHERDRSASAASSGADGEGSGSLWYASGTHAAGGERSLGVQAVGRRFLPGPAVAPDRQIPCDRPEVCTVTTHDLSRRSRTAARRSRSSTPGSITTIQTAPSSRSRAASPAPTASCTRGIGPFDIKSGTVMGYGKVELHSQNAVRAAFFTNILHGDADQPARPRTRLTGQPITFAFDTQTYDFEASNVQTLSAPSTSLNYGGNLRYNTFDLSIAPQADNRTEFGVYGQDEIFLSNTSAWTSARVSIASIISTTSSFRRERRS